MVDHPAPLPTPLAALLEAALNVWLRKHGQRGVERLAGRSIAVTVVPPGVGLVFLGAADRLQVLGTLDDTPDCVLQGAPLALAAAFARGDRSGVEIRGDAAVLGDLQRAFQGASLDWAGWFEAVAGAGSARPLLRAGEAARAQILRFLKRGEADLADYLQEEARWLPASGEFEALVEDLSDLRDAVARLEARIDALEQKRHPGSDVGPGVTTPG